jgi:hypothetical protein
MADPTGWERVHRVMDLTDVTRDAQFHMRFVHAGAGLAEEIGELMQALRHGRAQKVYEEAADVLWYIAQMEVCLGVAGRPVQWQAPGADIPSGTLIDYIVAISGALKRWARDAEVSGARAKAYRRIAEALPGLRLTVCLACYAAPVADLATVLELKHAAKIAAELDRRAKLRAERSPEVRHG